MDEEPGATPYDGYNPGSKDPFGRTIRTVIGRHRHMVVYITEDHAVGWNYDKMPERLRPAVGEFQWFCQPDLAPFDRFIWPHLSH